MVSFADNTFPNFNVALGKALVHSKISFHQLENGNPLLALRKIPKLHLIFAFRPKLCEKFLFPKNFHTKKLGEIRYFIQWTLIDSAYLFEDFFIFPTQ